MKKKGKEKLPSFLKKYFWDINFSDLSSFQDTYFIVERLIEYGDERAISWMRKNLPQEIVQQVVLSSRRISPKTAVF